MSCACVGSSCSSKTGLSLLQPPGTYTVTLSARRQMFSEPLVVVKDVARLASWRRDLDALLAGELSELGGVLRARGARPVIPDATPRNPHPGGA